jgi:hypothetical protein
MAQSTSLVTRPVECRDQNGNSVAYSFCDPTTMPSTGQIQTCAANTYSWTGTRGTCQATLSCQPLVVNTTNLQTCAAETVNTCATKPICMAQPS